MKAFKMKSFSSLLLICLWIILGTYGQLAGQGTAYTVESVPNPKARGIGFVSNPDNIISPTVVSRLNNMLTEMENRTTAQVAVVIVQSIGDANPKDFANQLFNKWGIGQAGKDNGLLVFTVMDQRRTEFETGYGLEGVLPDVVCYRIGMQELVPEFKEGRYGEGLIKAVQRIKLTLEDPVAAEEISANPSVRVNPYADGQFLSKGTVFLMIYGLIAMILGIYFIGRIYNVLRSREELYDKYLDLKKVHYGIFLFLIPLPYLFIYFFLNRRLKQLRYQPRYDRESGELLHLLSEEEEDQYLKAGQITEEQIGSVDYDVWLSESGDDLLILRYKKRFGPYKRCPKCTYLTYYQAYSKTVQRATYYSTGRQKVVHECKNCRHQKVDYHVIPMLVKSSSSGGGGGSSSFGGGSSGGGGAGVSW